MHKLNLGALDPYVAAEAAPQDDIDFSIKILAITTLSLWIVVNGRDS